MILVVLKRAVEEYVSNFKVMLSFGVLFIFLPLFVFFQQFFFSSGTVFLSLDSALLAAVGLVVAVIFLYFFSFFVSLTVYSVHRDVQSISFDTYWNTLFKDAALKVFFLYLVLAVLFYIISFFGFAYGFVFPALVLNFIISLVVMFCVQSIVLNEASLGEAVVRSAEFWLENPFTSAAIFVVASVLLFIIVCIELFLDLIGLPGMMVSFILSLVFLVPFIEQTKSYAYLLRTDLLRSQEITHAHAPKFTHAPHVSGTRLRERPKHGSKL